MLGDVPTVLCFGTLRRNKGIPELLDAIERVGPDAGIRFHVAGRGDPDLEAAVLAAADRMPQLRAEIDWITPERKTRLLREADLMVLPYTAFSSQSGVLHDAFGSHLPAVVTDVGALRASVVDGAAGWVVDPGDPEALAGALRDAFADPTAWQRAVRRRPPDRDRPGARARRRGAARGLPRRPGPVGQMKSDR